MHAGGRKRKLKKKRQVHTAEGYGEKIDKRRGVRVHCVCLLFPLRFPFGFVHLSFSVVTRLCFTAQRERLAPREKGWKGTRRVERNRRTSARQQHCLTKLRGIKFAFYCARFSDGSGRRVAVENSRLLIATTVVDGGGGSNSAISSRDMNSTV